jgi:HAE1 family hydrophobic/amphiphilic exporter-1
MRWLWMPIFWLTDLTLQFIYWSYPKILNLTLQHRLPVISLGLIFTAYAYYQIGNLKQEFMPKVHQGEFHVEIAFPVGTPLLQTAKRLQAIERDIAAMPNVANLSSVIGVEKTAAQNVDQGEHTAVLTLSLHGRSDLESLEREVIEQIRNLLLDVPSLNLKIVYPSLFSLRTPIEVEIKGENLSTLNNLSQQMLTLLQDIPSLRDIRSSAVGGLPEIRILFQRERMLQYGFNVEQLANTLRDKLHGTTATRYRIKEHRIDVSVRVKREQLKSVGELLNLSLISPSGVVVPLHQIARTHIDEGPSEIMRIGNRRSVLILAEVEGMALGEATSAIENQIAQLSLPPAYTANLSGQSEEMKRSLLSLLFALMLSVFLVYLVMASQFESLLSPLIILFSIPLAFIGVILLFLLLDMPISSMVLIGVIILTGIVVNNAIVLVDAINRIRSSGSSMDDSIRDAAKLRLRPILMTTITTALGLMPLALGLGEGSELRRPLAITIMAGLIFSTMLTLLLIPALYKITHLRRTENI